IPGWIGGAGWVRVPGGGHRSVLPESSGLGAGSHLTTRVAIAALRKPATQRKIGRTVAQYSRFTGILGTPAPSKEIPPGAVCLFEPCLCPRCLFFWPAMP